MNMNIAGLVEIRINAQLRHIPYYTGTAAALAPGGNVKKVDISALQQTLQANGMEV